MSDLFGTAIDTAQSTLNPSPNALGLVTVTEPSALYAQEDAAYEQQDLFKADPKAFNVLDKFMTRIQCALSTFEEIRIKVSQLNELIAALDVAIVDGTRFRKFLSKLTHAELMALFNYYYEHPKAMLAAKEEEEEGVQVSEKTEAVNAPGVTTTPTDGAKKKSKRRRR